LNSHFQIFIILSIQASQCCQLKQTKNSFSLKEDFTFKHIIKAGWFYSGLLSRSDKRLKYANRL
jgi:hypothetical protein